MKKQIFANFSDDVLFQSIMENMADSIYFKDRDCRLVRVSQKMAISLGYDHPDDLIGKTDVELFGKEFGKRTRQDDLKVMKTGEPIIGLVEFRTDVNGIPIWTSTTKLPLKNDKGEIFGLLGITREINELKRVESELMFLATHDVLTSLPNRFLLFDRLDQAISRAQRQGSMVAVLFVDLDEFKSINDSFGHAAGDLILVQIANQLTKNVREFDTVARIGGDEFVIVMESIDNASEATQIAQRIVTDINKGIDLYPINPKISVSIGISLFPEHGITASRLLGCADDAMYRAKTNRNTFTVFSP
jgi:two-component system, chemotaxis family, CheB/CheR fusion protein